MLQSSTYSLNVELFVCDDGNLGDFPFEKIELLLDVVYDAVHVGVGDLHPLNQHLLGRAHEKRRVHHNRQIDAWLENQRVSRDCELKRGIRG